MQKKRSDGGVEQDEGRAETVAAMDSGERKKKKIKQRSLESDQAEGAEGMAKKTKKEKKRSSTKA
jgi:hypothetical protein